MPYLYGGAYASPYSYGAYGSYYGAYAASPYYSYGAYASPYRLIDNPIPPFYYQLPRFAGMHQNNIFGDSGN